MKRGTFIKGISLAAGAISFPTIVPASVLGRNGKVAPSNKITIAMVGIGGQGSTRNLNGFLNQKNAQIVALCDCESTRIEGVNELLAQKNRKVSITSQDFRDIIYRDDVDAVCVSTPDHWHVPISVMSMNAGKDVFSEKPTFCIDEGTYLRRCVDKNGAIFQTGVEDRYLPEYVRMCEIVRNGGIGEVERIYTTLPLKDWQVPIRNDKIPDTLDYEMWIGPSEPLPYQREICAPTWRCISNFGTGTIGDWGTHQCDAAQWIIGQDDKGPVKIEVKDVSYATKKGRFDTIVRFNIKYTYDNGIEMHVTTGGTRIRIEGSKGWIESRWYGSKLTASSTKITDMKIAPDSVHVHTNPFLEHTDFIDCVLTRNQSNHNAQKDDIMSVMLHAANISGKLGRELKWDYKKREFINDDEANKFKMRSLRGQWKDIYKNLEA